MSEVIALLANQVVTAVFLTYIFILWVALVFWTAFDIHNRTENSWLRLLSILIVGIGWIFGFVLYLILRPATSLEEAKQRQIEEKILENQARSYVCPNCSEVLKEDFLFCSGCGLEVKKKCFSCQKLLEVGWNQCPYCGVVVGPRVLTPVREVPAFPEKRSILASLVRKLFVKPEIAIPSEVHRGRGRPRKEREVEPVAVKRGRGRPRKYEQVLSSEPKRGRGRPRKTPIQTA